MAALAKERLCAACESRSASELEEAIIFAYEADLEDIHIVEARELLSRLCRKIGVRFAAAEIARARLRLHQSWSSVDTALDGSNRMDALAGAGCCAIEAIKFGKVVGGLTDTLTDLEDMMNEHCRRWASFLLDTLEVFQARRDKEGMRTVLAEAQAAYRRLGGRSEFKECIIRGMKLVGKEDGRINAEEALQTALDNHQASRVRVALRDARRYNVDPDVIEAAVEWLAGARRRTVARWGLITVLIWTRQATPEVLYSGLELLDRACQSAKDAGVEGPDLDNIHSKVCILQEKRKVQVQMVQAAASRDPMLMQRALAAAKSFKSQDDEAMIVLSDRVATALKEEADKINARIAERKAERAATKAARKEVQMVAGKVQRTALLKSKTAVLEEMPELLDKAAEKGLTEEEIEAAKSALRVAQAKQNLHDALQGEEVGAVKLAIAEGEQLGLSPFLLAPGVRRLAEIDLLEEIDKALASLDIKASERLMSAWETKGFKLEHLNDRKDQLLQCHAMLQELNDKLISYSSEIRPEGTDGISESVFRSLEGIAELLRNKPLARVKIDCHAKLKFTGCATDDQIKQGEAQQTKECFELCRRIGNILKRLGCENDFALGYGARAVKSGAGTEVSIRVL